MRIPKSLRPLANVAVAAGWTITVTGGGHLKWKAPSGEIVFSPGSPSNSARGPQNLRAQLRRAGLEV